MQCTHYCSMASQLKYSRLLFSKFSNSLDVFFYYTVRSLLLTSLCWQLQQGRIVIVCLVQILLYK